MSYLRPTVIGETGISDDTVLIDDLLWDEHLLYMLGYCLKDSFVSIAKSFG